MWCVDCGPMNVVVKSINVMFSSTYSHFGLLFTKQMLSRIKISTTSKSSSKAWSLSFSEVTEHLQVTEQKLWILSPDHHPSGDVWYSGLYIACRIITMWLWILQWKELSAVVSRILLRQVWINQHYDVCNCHIQHSQPSVVWKSFSDHLLWWSKVFRQMCVWHLTNEASEGLVKKENLFSSFGRWNYFLVS